MEILTIQQFIKKAPSKRLSFNGCQIISHDLVRQQMFNQLLTGSIDQRINRRAGLKTQFNPWKSSPVSKSRYRHRKNELRKRGIRLVNP